MKPAIHHQPVSRRRKATRFNRATLERNFGKLRADLAGTTPPPDRDAIQAGRTSLPPGDRE
jgi:hypothetical protein